MATGLTARDLKMLQNAVSYILDDTEWVGCPNIDTRVWLYVTSAYRLSRLKYETAEAKILLAEPYLSALVEKKRRGE